MLKGIRHSGRLVTIAMTMARHDALFLMDGLNPTPPGLGILLALSKLIPRKRTIASKRPGERLAMALAALGPAFIKLGQTLATRPDLVGDEIAEDLATLQDRLPPFSFAEARTAIEVALGDSIDSIYTTIDEKPVAAASIAQVHFATTADDTLVAVKVLRPGIEQRFAAELETFFWFAGLLERSIPSIRRLRPIEIVRTLADSVAEEIDLRMEAAAASELQELTKTISGYRIPDIDWQRTAQRVLTLERVDGIRVSDTAALEAAGHDRAALARTIVEAFLRQAMEYGFFHADLHQGNLLVEPDGTVAAIDFGIMGRLKKAEQRYLAEILWGFLQRDYTRVAEVHFEAGYVPKTKSVASFAQALRAIGEPILGLSVQEISVGNLLQQLFATTESFEMETQPQLILLQKTMVTVEGLALQLDPKANMWELSRPVLAGWMEDHLGPKAKLADFAETAERVARNAPKIVDTLANLEELVERAEQAAVREASRRPQASNWPIAIGLLGGAAILGLILVF